jgi:mercuric ion transport protein
MALASVQWYGAYHIQIAEQEVIVMNPKQTMLLSVVAGIGASLCCLAPLVLLSLGIGGAFMTTLTAFEPARPLFTALALLFIGLSFRRLYLTSQICEPGHVCAGAETLAKQRLIFWLVTVPVLAMLVFPWFAPLFY